MLSTFTALYNQTTALAAAGHYSCMSQRLLVHILYHKEVQHYTSALCHSSVLSVCCDCSSHFLAVPDGQLCLYHNTLLTSRGGN